MFQVLESQTKAFDDVAERLFVDQLGDYLCSRSDVVLPRFPREPRRRIVKIMIARGRFWGATWESSLGLFADLMQTVAPSFDKVPEIRQALAVEKQAANERILEIKRFVPDAAWREASLSRVELYLFTAPELDTEDMNVRLAAALPVVLWDRVSLDQADGLAERGIRLANRLGVGELEDGPLVVAVSEGLYGSEFFKASIYPWAADVFAPRRRPKERLAMLRCRIALDFGRRV